MGSYSPNSRVILLTSPLLSCSSFSFSLTTRSIPASGGVFLIVNSLSVLGVSFSSPSVSFTRVSTMLSISVFSSSVDSAASVCVDSVDRSASKTVSRFLFLIKSEIRAKKALPFSNLMF